MLETLCGSLHPFMPFVTEELWQSLPWKTAANTPARARDGKPAILTLMFQAFPGALPDSPTRESERNIEGVRKVVEAIRNFRGENNISPKQEFAVRYVAAGDACGVHEGASHRASRVDQGRRASRSWQEDWLRTRWTR